MVKVGLIQLAEDRFETVTEHGYEK